jgi:hypothetical protein
MKASNPHGIRILTLAVATALTLWALVGVFGPKAGYTDALFEPDYTIQHSFPGGPLDEAGFQMGDSVISVEGIPVVELGMYSRWPRSLSRQPGESLSMVVERNGERVAGDIVFRERPTGGRKLQFGGILVGLSFLWFGVWVFLTVPSPPARQLLWLGLATGVALPGPDLGSWNGVRDHLQLAGVSLWILLLLCFFLSFPKAKKIMEGHLTSVLLFAPWVVLLGCLGIELAFHPRFYHSFGAFSGLLMLGYAALTLAAVLHTLIKTPGSDLRESGMGTILVGVGVAVVALLVWGLDAFFLQMIPGSDWLPLLTAAIPMSLALGVRQAAKRP